MRKRALPPMVLIASLLASQVLAQEHYTEGPVWRIVLIDIKPGKGTEYWTDLRKTLKPIWEDYKKQGIILDYTVSVKSTTDAPDDWDVALAFKFATFAALDGLTAKMEAVTLKAYGNAEARREAGAKRTEWGSLVGSFLMREVTPRDMPR